MNISLVFLKAVFVLLFKQAGSPEDDLRKWILKGCDRPGLEARLINTYIGKTNY